MTPRDLGTELEPPGRAGGPRWIWDNSLSSPGHLVEPTGPRTPARVAQESRSTSQVLGHGPELPGTAALLHGPTDTGLSRPGELVEPAGYHSQPRVVRDSWSTAWALGPGPESSGRAGRNTRALGHWPKMLRTAGRPPGASEAGVSRAGQVVDPVGQKNRTRVTREFLSNGGPSDPSASCPGNLVPREHSAQCRVTWGNWSTPWARGPAHESPGRACRPRGPSEMARVSRKIWSTPQALDHGPRSAGTSGRARRPSGMGPSLPGELVDNAGHRPERESPGSAGERCGTSEPSASRLGELVDHAGPGTIARDARDIWSTPRDLGPQRESPSRAGRHRGPSDTGLSCPGELVETTGYHSRARVVR